MKKHLFFTGLLCLSFFLGSAQSNRNSSMPLIGAEAPSFKAQSTNGELNFPKDFGSSWKILFSHPKDFTPVCSSELLELAYEQSTFDQLNAKLVVISTDMLDSHLHWKAAMEEIPYKNRPPVSIEFPLVDDHKYTISRKYGMIHPDVSIERNIRGVFFIDPDNKVRALYFYPEEIGRNVDEIKRTLIALQTNYQNPRLVTPANWNPGDDLMVPVLNQEETAGLNSPDSGLYQLSWFMTYRKEQ